MKVGARLLVLIWDILNSLSSLVMFPLL